MCFFFFDIEERREQNEKEDVFHFLVLVLLFSKTMI